MKDSGVDWIGAIPQKWRLLRIKDISPVNRGASPRPIDDPIYFDDDGEYAWVRISDVSASLDGFLESTTQRLSKLGDAKSVKRQPGDLFLSIAGTVGKACITKIKACIHDGFVYFPRMDQDATKKFFFYLFNSGLAYDGLGKFGTQLNLNTETVGSILVPLPPFDELIAIAAYLDQQTALIDQRLSTLEEKKSVLAELRKAIIHEAVTKGLNKHAKMKDSGVAWIGETPTHWTRLRIKDVCRAYVGAAANKTNYYVGLEHIQPWLGTYQAIDRTEVEASTGQLIAGGVMCFSKLRPYLAKAFVANESLFVTTELLTFVPRSAVVDAGFLTHYVLTHGFIAEVNDAVAGTKMPRVDWQTFATRTINLPPLSEQCAIANHLDQQTQHIAAQLATLDEQVQVLKELRKAIIHEAVTGKIDLSGAVTGKEDR